MAAAGLHTQADDVNARFMHARRGFKPERLSTLVSLSRRGSLLVAVTTHSPLPDPAARLAAPASKADSRRARRARARVQRPPTRRYMTRIARIPQRDKRLAWRRRVLVSLGGVLCLSSSTTLKAGSVAPQDDSPIGSRRRKVPAPTLAAQHATRLTPSGRMQQNAGTGQFAGCTSKHLRTPNDCA